MLEEIVQNRLGKNYRQRLFYGLLLVVVISMTAGFIRQILIQRRMDQRLQKRQEEMAGLKRRNQELRAKLQEAESPLFLENQARKMLGLPAVEIKPPPTKEIPDLRIKEEKIVPKYKKWLDLFLY